MVGKWMYINGEPPLLATWVTFIPILFVSVLLLFQRLVLTRNEHPNPAWKQS